MKRLLICLLLVSGMSWGATQYNPFTGQLDFTGDSIVGSTNTWTGGNVYQGYSTFTGSTSLSLSTLTLSNGTTFYENGMFISSGGFTLANTPIGSGTMQCMAIDSSSNVVKTTCGVTTSPGGSTGQMQWNSASSFAGSTYTVVSSTGISIYPPFDLIGLSSITYSSIYFDLSASTSVFGNTTVTGNTNGTYQLRISTTATFYQIAVSTMGHLSTKGTSPVLSSCGSSPSIVGSDTAFTITVGGTASGCVATFKVPFNATPTCTVSNESASVVNALSYTTSVTAITLSQTSLSNNVLDIICMGRD